MSPDQIAHLIWLLLAILLVGSGLVARRMALGRSVALIASWIGVILALWALVAAVQSMR